MNNYTIAITTFSLRIDMLNTLINSIRSHTDRKILLCINGEKDGDFNEEYRKKVLQLCLSYDKIFPIFFVEIRGLSKMWNTLLVHSDTDHVMVLNDDISVTSGDMFQKTQDYINSEEFNGLTLLNSSFSHYVVDRKLIDSIGYFDERLLGFGEEDADIMYRLNKIGMNINTIWVNGLVNIISQIRQDCIKKGSINNVEHKYSHFNREFVYGQKYKSDFSSPFRGMFDTPMITILDEQKPYTYESFFWENKNLLY
jgi:hypothetical protein